MQSHIGDYSTLALVPTNLNDEKGKKIVGIMKTYSDKVGYKEIPADMRNKLNAHKIIIKDGQRLVDFIKNNKVDFNAHKDAIDYTMKFFGVDPKKDKEIIAKWKAKGQLGNLVAEYLLQMSGAAVTDSERQETLKYLMGGNWTDTSSVLTHLKASIDYHKHRLTDTAKDISHYDPYTAYTIMKDYGTEPKKKVLDLEAFRKKGKK